MARLPKTFKVSDRFTTLPQAQAAYDRLVREVDKYFMYVRSDVERIEARMQSAEDRITVLETL